MDAHRTVDKTTGIYKQGALKRESSLQFSRERRKFFRVEDTGKVGAIDVLPSSDPPHINTPPLTLKLPGVTVMAAHANQHGAETPSQHPPPRPPASTSPTTHTNFHLSFSISHFTSLYLSPLAPSQLLLSMPISFCAHSHTLLLFNYPPVVHTYHTLPRTNQTIDRIERPTDRRTDAYTVRDTS